MKKFISGVLVGAILCLFVGVYAADINQFVAARATFPVLVNGKTFVTDKPIVVISGSTYMPLKAIGDVLGVKVLWNSVLSRVEVGEAIIPAPSVVPVSSIVDKIKAQAAKDWPNDYNMQLYQIKSETEAYNKIQALPGTADYNIAILNKAITDWPDNYQMQLYQYDSELKAYKELTN